MHTVGKLTSLNEEDMFNDNTNIEALADKCEVESAAYVLAELIFVFPQGPGGGSLSAGRFENKVERN